MCGIAGLVFRYPRPVDGRFAAAQAHRGPDQQGAYLYDGERSWTFESADFPERFARLALIHHRLSIIDLSEAGRQPMQSRDGRYQLVYNGEVYNYLELREELRRAGVEFHTQSDTEVVLQALILWGKAALLRFSGMFALAFCDVKNEVILLARDFFGIKPLYFHRSQDSLAFSSEMKALLRLPERSWHLNPLSAYRYLRHARTDDGEATLVREIEQLPPGSLAEIRLDNPTAVKVERYWQMDTRRAEISYEDATAQLRERFLRNIELHLRSDVPIGIALSGGLDSSALVCGVRYLQPKAELHAFSFIAGDLELSEEHWVDAVVSQTGARVHKVWVEPDELLGDLDELVSAQDQPFGGTSIYAQFRVFRAARDAGIKVMLDGQGGDEVFGGYDQFFGARLVSMICRGDLIGAVRFLAALGKEGHRYPVLQLAAPYLLPNLVERVSRRVLSKGLMPSWLNKNYFRKAGVAGEPLMTRPLSRTAFSDELVRTTRVTLPHLLRYEDRNSMHFSIESRVPFLTPDLVQFCLSLPERYHLANDGTRKNIFRDAMRGIVPNAVLSRQDKLGFVTPERNWLLELEPWVQTVFGRAEELSPSPIDVASLKRTFESVKGSAGSGSQQIWRCLNLVEWLCKNGVSTELA